MNEQTLQLDLEVSEELEEIDLDVSEQEELELEIEEGGDIGGVKDYNELLNKPKLNGRVIVGDIDEQDPTVPDWAKQPQKPTYTPQEIGISAIPLAAIADMFKDW